MQYINDYLNQITSLISQPSVISTIIATVGFYIIIELFERYIIGKVKEKAKQTDNQIDDFVIIILDKLDSLFYLFLAFFAAYSIFLHTEYQELLNKIFIVISVFYMAKVAIAASNFFIELKLLRKTETFEKPLKTAVKISIWTIALAIILQNLGVDITAVIASLGIGGVAVAFALQNVLSDVFASFSIYLDRPFEIGDFIIVEESMGTVKNIGIKSTRLQSLTGEELIIPNKALTDARVRNYKKMEERRIAFTVGVEYGTSIELLKTAKANLIEIIETMEFTMLDRVNLLKLGDYSLNFECVYFVESSDYNKYAEIQEKINFEILRIFKEKNINIAFPTQEIILHK
jgi:small-conductance mechanosensitive channel